MNSNTKEEFNPHLCVTSNMTQQKMWTIEQQKYSQQKSCCCKGRDKAIDIFRGQKLENKVFHKFNKKTMWKNDSFFE